MLIKSISISNLRFHTHTDKRSSMAFSSFFSFQRKRFSLRSSMMDLASLKVCKRKFLCPVVWKLKLEMKFTCIFSSLGGEGEVEVGWPINNPYQHESD
jgi:hypothetical protein